MACTARRSPHVVGAMAACMGLFLAERAKQGIPHDVIYYTGRASVSQERCIQKNRAEPE